MRGFRHRVQQKGAPESPAAAHTASDSGARICYA